VRARQKPAPQPAVANAGSHSGRRITLPRCSTNLCAAHALTRLQEFAAAHGASPQPGASSSAALPHRSAPQHIRCGSTRSAASQHSSPGSSSSTAASAAPQHHLDAAAPAAPQHKCAYCTHASHPAALIRSSHQASTHRAAQTLPEASQTLSEELSRSAVAPSHLLVEPVRPLPLQTLLRAPRIGRHLFGTPRLALQHTCALSCRAFARQTAYMLQQWSSRDISLGTPPRHGALTCCTRAARLSTRIGHDTQRLSIGQLPFFASAQALAPAPGEPLTRTSPPRSSHAHSTQAVGR